MKMKLLSDLDINAKTVVIREDLNVPLKDGKITSEKRLLASLPTIKLALDKGAAVIVLSHLGRPEEGIFSSENSLAPVADKLGELLGKQVCLVTLENLLADPAKYSPKQGEVVVAENVRFEKGEKKNSEELAKKWASLGDVYVMDAFATAHRAQATTEGAVRHAKCACAGPLLAGEVDALSKILENPAHPLLAIIGGSKVSTKLLVIDNLSKRVDQLIVGGGIANTFLKASGYPIGKSLCEDDLIPDAKRIMQNAKIPLPTDVVVAKAFAPDATAEVKSVKDVADDDMILDIGPDTAKHYAEIIAKAGTVVWNGPVGAFEIDQFGEGTKAIAIAVASSPAFTVTGGGDSIAALEKYGCIDKISYVSTAGGAFLEMLEGKELPALKALEDRA